jgi:hypothetical protein
MVRAREVGFDALTPILWFKIGNRTNEGGGRIIGLLRETVSAWLHH